MGHPGYFTSQLILIFDQVDPADKVHQNMLRMLRVKALAYDHLPSKDNTPFYWIMLIEFYQKIVKSRGER